MRTLSLCANNSMSSQEVRLEIFNYILAVFSIITMGFGIFSLLQLRQKLPGGVIRRRLQILLALLVFFFLGYLGSPFFSYIEQFAYTTLIVYFVFFFGAVFVLIVIKTLAQVLQLSGMIKK
jgi:Ca2+/Na+ antiporter